MPTYPLQARSTPVRRSSRQLYPQRFNPGQLRPESLQTESISESAVNRVVQSIQEAMQYIRNIKILSLMSESSI